MQTQESCAPGRKAISGRRNAGLSLAKSACESQILAPVGPPEIQILPQWQIWLCVKSPGSSETCIVSQIYSEASGFLHLTTMSLEIPLWWCSKVDIRGSKPEQVPGLATE
ncbi:hypothetical protein NN561_018990 [Cricetulus griseus]